MKIREGFVSNSSSSSFLIVGVSTKDINYEKLCESITDDNTIKRYMNHTCCGKKVTTPFCPACGRPKDEIEGVVDYKRMYHGEDLSYTEKFRVFGDDYGFSGNIFGVDLGEGTFTVDEINKYKDELEAMGYAGVKVFTGERYC